MKTAVSLSLIGAACGQAVPRKVRIQGQQFVLASSNATIVLGGPNIVVKGPPYLPSVSGKEICNDVVNDECRKAGTCKTCTTFNQADIDHIKSLGWNFIRLGVAWAGAQPRDEATLDPDFLKRLHAVLDLTDKNDIHVMLDNHGDMVGSAGCGNGVPMWVQKEAAPDLIGKPLETGFPYSMIPELNIKHTAGWSHCGKDASKWAVHAGDPDYNLKNDCCLAINSPNPPGLGFTTISQKTMDYVLHPGKGRDHFIRYWRLLAEAVKNHPSAFAAELMNEPISIKRRPMFDTWRAAAQAIIEVIPDMSVSFADVADMSYLPSWLTKLPGKGLEDVSHETSQWLKKSNNAFYAWHYGPEPTNINNAKAVSKEWNMPTFATETRCEQFYAAAKAGISHSYWHYSCYCNTGAAFGNRTVPSDTFGGCILGWMGGDSTKCPPKITALVV